MAGRQLIPTGPGRIQSVAFALITVVAATALQTVAFSVGPAAASTFATGTFACSNASGQIHYSPAWTNGGKHRITATVNVTFSGCSGGNPVPTNVVLSGKARFPNGRGSCSNGYDISAHFKANYSPLVKKSKVSVPGINLLIVGLTSLRTGGFATTGTTPFVVSGSYPTTGAGPLPILAASGGSTGNCTSGVTATTIKFGEFDLG
jgi:hypothetical protein